MQTLRYSVTLVSDAEPATGQGTDVLDSLVTVAHDAAPVLRASHVKGLMRQRLADIAHAVAPLTNHEGALADALFGVEGREGDDGAPSRVSVGDARALPSKLESRGRDDGASRRAPAPGAKASNWRNHFMEVSRTALTDLGTASGTTLRTAQAVKAGTRFEGVLRIAASQGEVLDLAVRLALQTIEAVGGGRTRGCGACIAEIEGDTRTPGALLRALVDAVKAQGIPRLVERPSASTARALTTGADVAWLELAFDAEDPTCCPETPVVGLNVIESGIAIPASAVQGALLTRLALLDERLASACFESPCFRAWPLLPRGPAGSREDTLPMPVRVSLSHRYSKLPVEEQGAFLFVDDSVTAKPFDWREAPRGATFKGGDGVLLRSADGDVKLWKGGDMPRVISAHAVHHVGDPGMTERERNLFTVEAIAPLAWAGLVALPREAADRLLEDLARDSWVAFGKSRSVRGRGRLTARMIPPGSVAAWGTDGAKRGRVFVAQSPIAIPDDWEAIATASETLEGLFRDSPWGRVESAWANAGVRFGWSRHRKGVQVGDHARLRARRCILPGAVVVLAEEPRDLAALLLAGVGGGREHGFGALLPHPGKASDFYKLEPALESLRSSNEAGRTGLKLWKDAGMEKGPSPSQIAGLMQRVRLDRSKALAYLEGQSRRPERIWRKWSHVIDAVRAEVEKDPHVALKALRTWQDLAVTHRSRESRS